MQNLMAGAAAGIPQGIAIIDRAGGMGGMQLPSRKKGENLRGKAAKGGGNKPARSKVAQGKRMRKGEQPAGKNAGRVTTGQEKIKEAKEKYKKMSPEEKREINKGRARGEGRGVRKPGEGVKARKPGAGGEMKKPGEGVKARKPRAGGGGKGLRKPGEGVKARKPGVGGEMKKPGEGVKARKPGVGGGMKKPGEGVKARKPGVGGGGKGLRKPSEGAKKLARAKKTPANRGRKRNTLPKGVGPVGRR